jgi:hypothetical protein
VPSGHLRSKALSQVFFTLWGKNEGNAWTLVTNPMCCLVQEHAECSIWLNCIARSYILFVNIVTSTGSHCLHWLTHMSVASLQCNAKPICTLLTLPLCAQWAFGCAASYWGTCCASMQGWAWLACGGASPAATLQHVCAAIDGLHTDSRCAGRLCTALTRLAWWQTAHVLCNVIAQSACRRLYCKQHKGDGFIAYNTKESAIEAVTHTCQGMHFRPRPCHHFFLVNISGHGCSQAC